MRNTKGVLSEESFERSECQFSLASDASTEHGTWHPLRNLPALENVEPDAIVSTVKTPFLLNVDHLKKLVSA